MKLLYLEPVGGIAGDMFLAAALDLGVPLDALRRALSGLGVEPFRLEPSRSVRHAISGTHLDVVPEPQDTPPPQRGYSDICQLIERATTLSPAVKARAQAIFRVIGEAEAKIHGVSLEAVHFHEVGALDSIVDICGAAWVLEALGEPKVFAAPPPLGSGTVRAAHGVMPVPAPATLEILRDVPVRFEGVGELTTPTGAALLKALAQVGTPPEMVVEKVGYGVGTKDFKDRANVLRASLGRGSGPTARSAAGAESLLVVEANLDDCSPQLLGALVEAVLEKGALDAWVAPVTMKKGRPGHLFGALVPVERRETVADALLEGSTTLGVRFYPVERTVLERRFETVETSHGAIQVKVAFRGSKVFNASPEFEDCREVAAKAGVPVKQVWGEALAAYWSGPGRGVGGGGSSGR